MSDFHPGTPVSFLHPRYAVRLPTSLSLGWVAEASALYAVVEWPGEGRQEVPQITHGLDVLGWIGCDAVWGSPRTSCFQADWDCPVHDIDWSDDDSDLDDD